MTVAIEYREAKVKESQAIYLLIKACFEQFVAPGYSAEGVAEFLKFIEPGFLERRIKGQNILLVAVKGAQLVGVIEVRNVNHISLLFVDHRYQRLGIGRELFHQAQKMGREMIPGLDKWTVHAAPNAVKAYEKMGFRRLEDEKVTNGIRYIPMELLE